MQSQADLTKRQREVLERVELGYSVRHIANDIGVTRNAVYQTIDRLRRSGALPETFTVSGQPSRRDAGGTQVGAIELAPVALAPRESNLRRLRELARGANDEAAYAAAIEAAIASADVAALAYELGRADVAGLDDLPRQLAEAALRRLGVLEPESPNV